MHLSESLNAALCIFRELREKEEIEKYRMERPKIQQQFSDLKVYACTRYAQLSNIPSFFFKYDTSIYLNVATMTL